MVLWGLHFWQWCIFLGPHWQSSAKSHDYWELVNEWVWFESQICRGWLLGQLGEVLSVKTQGTGNMVHLRDTMCSMAERCCRWLEFTDVSEVHVVLFPWSQLMFALYFLLSAILHVGSICTPFSNYVQPLCRGCTIAHAVILTGNCVPECDYLLPQILQAL